MRTGTGLRRGSHGFSLLEVMIASSLVVVVMGVASLFLVSMSENVASETALANLEVNASRVLTDIADTIVDGRVIDFPPGPDLAWHELKVERPVFDADDDGDIIDEVIEERDYWGVRVRRTGEWVGVDGYLLYRWAEDVNAARRVLSEETLGDVNNDGDVDDVFVRGRLIRERYEAASPDTPVDSREILGSVLQVETASGSGVYGGDISGDEVGDPIFSMDAGGDVLMISLWLYDQYQRGRPILHHATTQVRLRNQNLD